MKQTIQYFGTTNQGQVRERNEDNWIVDVDLGLFIVADGMGGQFAGELASRIVVQALPSLVRQELRTSDGLSEKRLKRRLFKAIAKLSESLNEQTRNEPGLSGMGSTLVCALIRDAKAFLAYMGDSRAYRFREGKLKLLTKDHTIAQLLRDSGEITEDEAKSHPGRTGLTRSVGMEGRPLPQIRTLRLKGDDVLLLCSDGLTTMISDKNIQATLGQASNLEEKVHALVDAANKSGGKDNITVLLLQVMMPKAQWHSPPAIAR